MLVGGAGCDVMPETLYLHQAQGSSAQSVRSNMFQGRLRPLGAGLVAVRTNGYTGAKSSEMATWPWKSRCKFSGFSKLTRWCSRAEPESVTCEPSGGLDGLCSDGHSDTPLRHPVALDRLLLLLGEGLGYGCRKSIASNLQESYLHDKLESQSTSC